MIINERILNIDHPEDAKILRRKAIPFDFEKYSRKDRDELIKKMRAIMESKNGVGLAANQIGQDFSLFVAKADNKFYAIFNPEIIKTSESKSSMEEGCLSVLNHFGRVSRPDSIVIKGADKNGKTIKIKAWGLLAFIFQHEIDHLNGRLFIDYKKS